MHTPTDLLTAIAEYSGITVNQLAIYLQTEKSRVSRYRNAGGSLSPEAMHQVARLYSTLQQADAGYPATRANEALPVFAEDAAMCIARCHPLKKQLAVMQRRYRQALAAVQWLEQEKIAATATVASPRQLRWLDEQLYRARKKITACGPPAQRRLEIAIALQEYEAQLLQGQVVK